LKRFEHAASREKIHGGRGDQSDYQTEMRNQLRERFCVAQQRELDLESDNPEEHERENELSYCQLHGDCTLALYVPIQLGAS
jgi:hypothetical protein